MSSLISNFFSGRPKNRTPRNMFIANLCLSGLAMTLFCIPPTFMQILYGGWWHLGLVACKLVPAIQGRCRVGAMPKRDRLRLDTRRVVGEDFLLYL